MQFLIHSVIVKNRRRCGESVGGLPQRFRKEPLKKSNGEQRQKIIIKRVKVLGKILGKKII